MNAAPENLFAPESPDFVADPYPAYAALRAGGRAHWYAPTRQWLIPHYEDVSALLRDRRLGRTYLHRFTHEEFGRQAPPAAHEPFHTLNDHGLLDLEAPDHTRIRRLVSKAFTPRTVERLVPTVRGLAAGLVDGLVERGGGDLLAEVAEPLPVAVIAEMLGVPEEDEERGRLRPWSADICGMFELNPSKETARRAVNASIEFSGYLRELIERRRAKPGDDLISALVGVAELTEQEMISTCVLLLNAGHEATVNTTANGWWTLLRHPEQLARLRAEPERLLPTAVEEVLRYDTPLQMFERWVLDDIEVGGQVIPRGSEVALLFGSANRDPARFGPAADVLDLARADNPHITFGAGIHYCLGAPLARLELTAVFAELLRKAPRLRLAAEPRWKPGYVIRGVEELRVAL
ncbi:cytochrome P450 [Streptomyces sp. NBC_01216]|uniref:cytochrome P450 n=1 Tax=unclassified Streptomyces TaxID=2593676 RepID=UPI002E112D53|nr:cytochrome P450 [Streptomyces sp. NBC_01216]